MISKGATFKVNVTILSTLLLEFSYVFIVMLYLLIYYYYRFSIARSFQDTFTAYEYTQNVSKYEKHYYNNNLYIYRINWDLHEFKSPSQRSFGLPKDNVDSHHNVYGDINIDLEPLPLTRYIFSNYRLLCSTK